MKVLFTILFMLASCSLSGQEQAVVKKTITPDETILYKSTPQGDLMLHIFYPEGEPNGQNRMVVVQFFGGGWSSGNPNQFYRQSKLYNQHGIVGISAEYRVSQSHKTTPFECVEDGKSAIRWVRENAQRLGIDPQRIIASGGSAGAHIAACTAIIDGYDCAQEDLSVSSKPMALILFNPVLDTTSNGYGADKLVGQETLISPFHHVCSALPPTIVMHGTADTIVPFVNAEEFTEAMREAGNRSLLIPFEGRDHGFFNGNLYNSKKSNEDFELTMQYALKFISEL